MNDGFPEVDITLLLPLVVMTTMMMMAMVMIRTRFKGPADNVHIHPQDAGRSQGSGRIMEPQVYN